MHLNGKIRYKNLRMPHVESDEEHLTGRTTPLSTRREKKLDDGYIVVMYDVVSVYNRGHQAHITVYHGRMGEHIKY